MILVEMGGGNGDKDGDGWTKVVMMAMYGRW